MWGARGGKERIKNVIESVIYHEKEGINDRGWRILRKNGISDHKFERRDEMRFCFRTKLERTAWEKGREEWGRRTGSQKREGSRKKWFTVRWYSRLQPDRLLDMKYILFYTRFYRLLHETCIQSKKGSKRGTVSGNGNEDKKRGINDDHDLVLKKWTGNRLLMSRRRKNFILVLDHSFANKTNGMKIGMNSESNWIGSDSFEFFTWLVIRTNSSSLLSFFRFPHFTLKMMIKHDATQEPSRTISPGNTISEILSLPPLEC